VVITDRQNIWRRDTNFTFSRFRLVHLHEEARVCTDSALGHWIDGGRLGLSLWPSLLALSLVFFGEPSRTMTESRYCSHSHLCVCVQVCTLGKGGREVHLSLSTPPT
jgi:hypothetical protein